MPFVRTIRLIFTFYKSFAFASLLATVCCCYLFRKYGTGILTGVFWFKVATMAVLFYFINLYKQKEYYYYQNLGISKGMLWGVALGFDFILFIFLLTKIHPLK